MEELGLGTAMLATPGGMAVILWVLFYRFLDKPIAKDYKLRRRVTTFTIVASGLLLAAQVALFLWEQLT